MMICDCCGKEFPADARACLESGVESSFVPDQGEEWRGDTAPTLTPDQLTSEQSEQIKAEMGLDDAQLEELLRTGRVEGLGSIVCLECQESAEGIL